jgi:hypothetical protein
LDGCPPEYNLLIEQYCNAEDSEIIELNKVGNFETFRVQINLLLSQSNAEYIFLAEDDYLYLPKGLQTMLAFMQANASDVHFVTPHDQTHYYQQPIHAIQKVLLKVGRGKHWRTAASTCLTFVTKKEHSRHTKAIFLTYCKGNHDFSVWVTITGFMIYQLFLWIKFCHNTLLIKAMLKVWLHAPLQCFFGRKWKLWVPITASGRHMHFDERGRNVEWEQLAENYANQSSLANLYDK